MLTVLVTGAAGLIGGEVCARAVARGHRVVAMVHSNPLVRGNDGAVVPVAQVVRGDVRAEMLGLDPAVLRPQVMVHCAAALEFDAPEEVLHAVNVQGTAHAAAFARATGARLLHVSTAYVCGLTEGPIADAPVAAGTRFANRYEASKAAGEALVRDSGVPFAIARPSIVLGESDTGRVREFPSLCNVFRLLARGKAGALPVRPGATLDLVPIDHVAAGIVFLAERMAAAAGGTFHLVSGNPLPAEALVHGVARVAHFPDPCVIAPQDFALDALPAAEQRLLGPLLATFGGYLTRDPRFSDHAFRAQGGAACPPTDAAWLDRLIAYGIARGYLPAAPASGRRDNAVPADRARPLPTAARP